MEVTDVADDYADTARHEIKMLVCGPPGSGKTLFASTWPRPLYLDIEGRLLSIRHRKGIRRVRCETIHDVEEVKNELQQDLDIRAKTFGGPIDTVVIDTVDELARLAQQERLKTERRETFTMNDWSWFGDYLRSLCRAFRNLQGLNVIFNCHIRANEDGETGKIVYRPDIQGSVGNEIASYVDIAVLLQQRLTVDVGSGDRVSLRVLQTYPDPAHDWVKDQSYALPAEMVLNFVDDGERILNQVFGDSVPEPGPSVIETVEPVTEPVVEAPEMLAETIVTESVTSQPTPTPSVPKKGTERAEEPFRCARCGKDIEDRVQGEISEIRVGERLCRKHFAEVRAAEGPVKK